MDIYRDYFTREELLLSLSNTQYVPGMLGASGLFRTIGLSALTLAIESLPDNDVAESAAIPRGGPAKPLMLEKRNVKTFPVASYAWSGAVLADEVLGIRASGIGGAGEVFATRRDEMAAKLRRQADWQHEYLRVSTLNTPNNDFGNKPADVVVAFGTADSAVRTAIHKQLILPLESALGGLPYTGLDAYCSEGYWEGLIDSKTVRETYLNTAAAAELRNMPADSFTFGGITWHRYRAGGNIAIEANKAKIVPRGVDGLFVQAFGPNDTLQSVGSGELGQPYYLDAYPLDDDKGYRMSLQTHPKMLCTRPTVIQTAKLS